MKKLLLLTLLLVNTANAGRITREIRATNTDGVTGFLSLVRNPSFERGKRFWSESGGTFTITNTTADVGSGSLAGSWDSNAAGQTLCSALATVPSGDENANYEAGFNLKCASGTCTHKIEIQDGSSNVLFSQSMTSGTSFIPNYYNAGPGGTGSKKLCLTSVASDEPTIYLDDGYLGRARNIGSVAQANLVASGYIAGTTGCQLSRTSTTLGALTDDTDCPGVTIETNTGPGSLQTTDANNAKFTVTGLQPGIYSVFVDAYAFENANNSATLTLALSDGTTTTGNRSQRAEAAAGGVYPPVTINGVFNYTSGGDKTFTLFGAASGSNTITVENTTATINRINFRIYRFPSSSEIAVRPELLANSWSGKHGDNCSLASGTGSSLTDWGGDSTCTFTELTNNNFGTVTSFTNGGNNSAGIVFTPKKAQRYKVCSDFVLSQGGATANQVYQLADGSNNEIATSASTAITGGNYEQKNICGIFYASSTASQTIKLRINPNGSSSSIGAPTGGSAVNWTIFAIDQSLPAPVLVGSVTAKYAGPGVAGWVSFGGASERSQCTSTPCTIYDQSGTTSNFISSVTRASTGNYTINFVSGVFTRAPYVVCYDAQGNSNTSFMMTNGSAPTTTAFGLAFSNYNIPGNRDTQADCLILGR